MAVLPGHRIVAGPRALELVPDAGHDLTELLLPNHAAVPARARGACRVEDELLEVVGVGPAALVVVDLAVRGVGISVITGEVPR